MCTIAATGFMQFSHGDPTMTRPCACCGEPFEPRPQVPDQTFCTSPDCQRARKREWQRAKLQSDPDYRINQHAVQQAWSQRNPDYWRRYREAQPDYSDLSQQPMTTTAGAIAWLIL